MTLQSLVHETASAPGTNVTFNLAGPVAGRRSFAMGFTTGAPAYYVMTDGVQSEWGLGTFTAGSPNTLSRTTVIGNSINTTARLNFTGAVDVFNAPPAEEMLVLSDGPLAGFRNLIINGNPTINQRGYVSGVATTGANQYTLDRWRVVTSGQNVAFSIAAGLCTVTAPANGMEQVIEGASNLGGLHTISWQGPATATVNGVAAANGSQVTLTGGADVTVRMSGGAWSQLQLEPGRRKTPFERRPVGVELALCQRYFWAMPGSLQMGAITVAGAGASFSFPIWFPATMRAAPTLSNTAYSGNVNVSATGFGAINRGGVVATITGSGAGDAGIAIVLDTLWASAEL